MQLSSAIKSEGPSLQNPFVPPRLLALDDNRDSAELIVRVARQCGYDARSLIEPSKLEMIWAEWRPDVLTLDLSMPEEDGLHKLSFLRQQNFKGPLIVISGHDDWFRKVACEMAECNGIEIVNHLGKPVHLRELRGLLNKLRVRHAAP